MVGTTQKFCVCANSGMNQTWGEKKGVMEIK